MSRRALAQRMAACCRQLATRGLIAGRDGNVSGRFGRNRALVTPTGTLKGELRGTDMVEVSLAGRRLKGRRNPTSELDLHLRILNRRPDVGAVVHAHPPVATAFAVAGEGFTSLFVLPELIFLVGSVPLVPYATPGTPAVGDGVEPYLEGHNALLLANHGAVTMGRTLEEAWIRMETLEHGARILFGARLLGRVTELEPAAVAQLEALRARAV
jgi:L-fuculose-phosphate aldolase